MRALLLAVSLGLYPALAAGLNSAMVQRACIRDVVPVPPFATPSIPVGCDLVDCCPGCPAAGPIEWRIRLDSKVATRAELRFDGLSAQEVGELTINGAATRDGERIVLRSGSARIGGLPRGGGAPVAVGVLQPLVSDQAARRLPQLLQAAPDLTDRIRVEQFVGPFLVNAFSWTWMPRPCLDSPKLAGSAADTLKIDGIAAGDEVSVMLFGRTSTGCKNGKSSATATTFSTTGEKLLGNRLSATGPCPSKVAVFSKKHAMKWQPLTWTDQPGDVRTVTLEPVIDAALNVWITDEAQRDLAEESAQKAHDLFLENRVGVRLAWKVENVSAVQGAPGNAVEIVNAGIGDDAFADCKDLASIRAQPFYVAKTLNVYYVNKPLAGRNCAIKTVPTTCTPSDLGHSRRGDANITFVGSSANPTTLVHELGHAYGLRPICSGGHTSGADFPDNIMSTGSNAPRTKLTLGQVFRMNTHKDHWGGTMLIPNNIPTRAAQTCFPDQFSRACPKLKVPWP